MISRYLQFGDVIVASFPQQNPQGHEQQGYRPCIVVGIPNRLGNPRFDLIVVVPLTSDRGQIWAIDSSDLYPRSFAGTGGLRSPSIVLLDQIRVLNISRIVSYQGSLTPEEYEPILIGIRRMISP
jgi:mRNA interferase MazF